MMDMRPDSLRMRIVPVRRDTPAMRGGTAVAVLTEHARARAGSGDRGRRERPPRTPMLDIGTTQRRPTIRPARSLPHDRDPRPARPARAPDPDDSRARRHLLPRQAENQPGRTRAGITHTAEDRQGRGETRRRRRRVAAIRPESLSGNP